MEKEVYMVETEHLSKDLAMRQVYASLREKDFPSPTSGRCFPSLWTYGMCM